jgi:hypothetical protein
MHKIGLVLCASSAIALAGCAKQMTRSDGRAPLSGGASRPSFVESAAPPEASSDIPQSPWINITPFTAVVLPEVSSRSALYSGAYTRLVVTSVLPQGESSGTSYDYRDRGAMSRFFAPRHTSLNFSAKITDGSFVATVPLMTIDHVSTSSDGEGFIRIIDHQAENYPLFLLKQDGSNSKVTAQFALKGTSQYQGPISGSVAAAQDIVKLVAPHSAVVTTLTQQGLKDTSAALDTVIAKLLATSIDEEHWIDDDVGVMGCSTGIAITLKIPDADHEGKWNTAAARLVGTWYVSFAPPRPSIFSDIEVCTASTPSRRCAPTFAAAAELAEKETVSAPEEVLQFQLIANAQSLGTISSFLKQQSWYSTAQKQLGVTRVKKDDVSQFCRSIKEAIVGLDLNRIDAGIVAKAMQSEIWISKDAQTAMGSTKECGYYRGP